MVSCPAGIVRMRSRRSMSLATRDREADGPRRVAQVRGRCRHGSRHVRRAQGCVHPEIVKIANRRQAPNRDLLRSTELQRRVTTATPFGARDGREVKEPWERFELTAHAWVGQWVGYALAFDCRRFRVAIAAGPNGLRGQAQAANGTTKATTLQAGARRRSGL